MFKLTALLGLFLLTSHFAIAQCPVEANTCQGSSPCIEIDLGSITLNDVGGNCEVSLTVNLVQGSGGGTIKKIRIGAVANAGDQDKLCEEFFDIQSGTTSVSHTFTFTGICFLNGPFDFTVEGYTCLNNDNCCCGRQTENSDNALPVELISFRGRAQKNENVLTWTTASEENALLFSIEKSLDGRTDFQTLGEVMAAGYSETPRNYFYTDGNPLRTNYYRLMSLDHDGSFEYSDVIAVQRKDISFSFLDVFPVPASNNVTAIIQSDNETNAEILLYNLQGQKIIHRKDKLTEGVNRINLNWYQNGDPMYFLTVYNGREWIVKKIILMEE